MDVVLGRPLCLSCPARGRLLVAAAGARGVSMGSALCPSSLGSWLRHLELVCRGGHRDPALAGDLGGAHAQDEVVRDKELAGQALGLPLGVLIGAQLAAADGPAQLETEEAERHEVGELVRDGHAVASLAHSGALVDALLDPDLAGVDVRLRVLVRRELVIVDDAVRETRKGLLEDVEELYDWEVQGVLEAQDLANLGCQVPEVLAGTRGDGIVDGAGY